MSFAAIQDQTIPLRLLRQLLVRKRIPNGLLFWGPDGVGKGLTAREFAKAVNCREAEGDACGRCLACQKADHGNHPDIHTVAPTKKSRTIRVEHIEDIIELASLRPYEGNWRVFIIHEADRMNASAQNHLLKTLEEPLGKSVFVLVTQYPQILLPTIRSRCQRVRFGALRPETVRELLEQHRGVSREDAEAIAALSGGQMTRALDLVDSEKRAVVLDVVSRLAQGEDPLSLSEEFGSYLSTQKAQIEAAAKKQFAPEDPKSLSKEDREELKAEQEAFSEAVYRRAILDHLYLFETWYRDALVFSATGQLDRVLNRDQQAQLESAGTKDPFETLTAIGRARLYLERFLSEDRVFRDLFFALAGHATAAPVTRA
jgi:DNA polymerase-3 subunit delta'